MTAENDEGLAARSRAITALLRHFEWSPTAKNPGRFEVWRPDDGDLGDLSEILVPINPALSDYEGLISRARRQLLAQYGRPARDMFKLLETQQSAALDQTQWQKHTPLEAGLIDWESGERMYAAARVQLSSSAKATREKRRYHGNSSAYVAKRFLESSYMGQTDIGSFIITAYTPGNSRFYSSRRDEEIHTATPRRAEAYSGHEILDTFESALKAVRSGLDQFRRDPRVELFLETVQEGVSYEFTKALGEFTRDGDSAVRIARTIPGMSSSRSVEVAFDSVEAPTLDTVANLLALNPEPLSVSLTGEVTLLSRSMAAGDRVIRINVEDGAEIRKARVRLNAEQYELAMEAHRQELSIQVSGTLEKEGKLYWLYNASELRLIDDDEDDLMEVQVVPEVIQDELEFF